MNSLHPADRSFAQRLAIILAVIVQIGATYLPQLGLGEPIGSRSDAIRTLITPSGWAFAIWGPLFLGSAVFAIWQFLPAQKTNDLLARIGWPAAVALAAQGVWAIYTQFASLTAISVVIILTSLVSLLMILRALCEAPTLSDKERWLTALVFSGLAAWLTAASIVNVSASLVYHGIGGNFAYPLAAAIMVAVGGVIAALATVRSRGNPWYAMVFGWALLAIYFRGGQEASAIAIACAGAAILVALAAFIGLSKPGNRRHWIGV
ncbi:MAG: hypothetical protein AAF291_08665 [Pseudomonadota bacterium]